MCEPFARCCHASPLKSINFKSKVQIFSLGRIRNMTRHHINTVTQTGYNRVLHVYYRISIHKSRFILNTHAARHHHDDMVTLNNNKRKHMSQHEHRFIEFYFANQSYDYVTRTMRATAAEMRRTTRKTPASRRVPGVPAAEARRTGRIRRGESRP